MGLFTGYISEQIKGKPHLKVLTQNWMGSTVQHTNTRGVTTLLSVYNFDYHPQTQGISPKKDAVHISCFGTPARDPVTGEALMDKNTGKPVSAINKRNVSLPMAKGFIDLFCAQGPQADINPAEMLMSEEEMAEVLERLSERLGTQTAEMKDAALPMPNVQELAEAIIG